MRGMAGGFGGLGARTSLRGTVTVAAACAKEARTAPTHGGRACCLARCCAAQLRSSCTQALASDSSRARGHSSHPTYRFTTCSHSSCMAVT
jgi:hypothetical protein